MEGQWRGEGGTAKENGRQQRKVGSTWKERRKKAKRIKEKETQGRKTRSGRKRVQMEEEMQVRKGGRGHSISGER